MGILGRIFSPGGCYICHRNLKLRNKLCNQCQEAMGLACRNIEENIPFLDGGYFIMEYRNLTRQIIGRMKFKEESYLAEVFAGFMADYLESGQVEGDFDGITFIPMTRSKKSVRGYNQGEEIGRKISELREIPLLDLLEKTREGKDQIGLTSRERFKNVKGSFEVNLDCQGKNILLVDDVLTTGATLMEASRVLKAAGANKVTALVIVKADYSSK